MDNLIVCHFRPCSCCCILVHTLLQRDPCKMFLGALAATVTDFPDPCTIIMNLYIRVFAVSCVHLTNDLA